VTVHPRRDWTSVPAANSNPVVRSLLDGVANHWNGPAVPRSAFTDPRSYLEGVRRFHVHDKGWSDIAYNLAVDQTGDIWILRGLDYQSGANGATDVNDRFLAILFILGEGQKPSAQMLAGGREAVAMFRAKYPTATKIVTHHAIRPDPTACPGPDLTRETNAGTFEPETQEPDVQLTDKITVPDTYETRRFGADPTVGAQLARIGEWAYLARVDAGLALATAQAGRPLTEAETEAAVAKVLATKVLNVDINVGEKA
jgi:hypothetical protein